MIWVLLSIGIILIIGLAVFGTYCDDWESAGGILSGIGIAIGVIITISSLITGIVLGVKITNKYAIIEQIAIYEEENIKLEREVDIIVKAYMSFEGDLYPELKNESSIVLIQLFPELKSNELVNKQIDIIYTNNIQIKELKSNLAHLSQIKWWLSFKYN